MGILDRIGNLVKGNVSAALNKLEDPEKMLDVLIEDLRKSIADARRKVADALTEQKLLKNQIDEANKNADLWLARAEKAIKANEDGLAQDALVEKNKAVSTSTTLMPRWEQLTRETDALKEDLKEMELQFEETMQKKTGLVAQAKVAKARAASAQAIASPLSNGDNKAAFSRAEEKIKRMEAGADASRELSSEQLANDPNAKFARLDRKMGKLDAADELAQLKAKLAEKP